MKTLRFLLYSCAVCLALILSACSSDSLEDEPTPMTDPNSNPNPPASCDTANMSFAGDIKPIIETNCYSGCHNGASPTSGFSLETYTGVKAKVNEGRLYGAVAHQAGFVAMPQGGDRLSDCTLAKIKSWIDAGAPNN